ncbi:unnamed protein product [Discosporangium mesarthrocarpum]
MGMSKKDKKLARKASKRALKQAENEAAARARRLSQEDEALNAAQETQDQKAETALAGPKVEDGGEGMKITDSVPREETQHEAEAAVSEPSSPRNTPVVADESNAEARNRDIPDEITVEEPGTAHDSGTLTAEEPGTLAGEGPGTMATGGPGTLAAEEPGDVKETGTSTVCVENTGGEIGARVVDAGTADVESLTEVEATCSTAPINAAADRRCAESSLSEGHQAGRVPPPSAEGVNTDEDGEDDFFAFLRETLRKFIDFPRYLVTTCAGQSMVDKEESRRSSSLTSAESVDGDYLSGGWKPDDSLGAAGDATPSGRQITMST